MQLADAIAKYRPRISRTGPEVITRGIFTRDCADLIGQYLVAGKYDFDEIMLPASRGDLRTAAGLNWVNRTVNIERLLDIFPEFMAYNYHGYAFRFNYIILIGAIIMCAWNSVFYYIWQDDRWIFCNTFKLSQSDNYEMVVVGCNNPGGRGSEIVFATNDSEKCAFVVVNSQLTMQKFISTTENPHELRRKYYGIHGDMPRNILPCGLIIAGSGERMYLIDFVNNREVRERIIPQAHGYAPAIYNDAGEHMVGTSLYWFYAECVATKW